MNGADKNKRFMLIVDHNVDDCFSTAMLLKQLGYTIYTAPSAEKALAIISVYPPLAIFADAGSTSTALLAGIKKNPQFSAIPFILLSTTPNAILEGRARRGEFAGFLNKPINIEKLFQIVESAIEKGPRRSIRIVSALQADLSGKPGSAEGLVTNLSESGMFFRTLDPHSVHSRLTVSFEIKEQRLQLETEVVYICTFGEGPFNEPGMGMKFLQIRPEDQATIKAYILEEIEKRVAR